MAYLINGQPVNIYREYFRVDGVRYANLLDASVRAKLGIIENSDPDPFEPNSPNYDQRFYWGPNNPKRLNDEELTDEQGNKSIATGLKTQWIEQVKDTANKMLSRTDWVVIRNAERGVEIPTKVADKRAGIVAECSRLETDIEACTTVEELIAVVMAQNWPQER